MATGVVMGYEVGAAGRSAELTTEKERHHALACASRLRILDALRSSSHALDVQEIAAGVDLHVSTVREHLDVLEHVGLVSGEPEIREKSGRPRILYRALDDHCAVNAWSPRCAGYHFLARALAGGFTGCCPDPRARGEQTGARYGRHLIHAEPFSKVDPESALGVLEELLCSLGFEPQIEARSTGEWVMVTHCPFRDVASTHPDVTCALHRGLIDGALTDLGAVAVRQWSPCPVGTEGCVAVLAAQESESEPN